ncbi:IS66 family transposase [Levilactobacillus suantsaiihabitans]|uniref:IS66 family transposase n=1 Tax=Levilactobacillus suantsaiihabitans TaxID=2487722 RepID=UPI002989D02E|nr:transposase [Levilactobacillus suantsaiihabitans]
MTYARNQRTALNKVIDYGSIDFSNNASERNMKSFVIGRKNWPFSTSPAGAKAQQSG